MLMPPPYHRCGNNADGYAQAGYIFLPITLAILTFLSSTDNELIAIMDMAYRHILPTTVDPWPFIVHLTLWVLVWMWSVVMLLVDWFWYKFDNAIYPDGVLPDDPADVLSDDSADIGIVFVATATAVPNPTAEVAV